MEKEIIEVESKDSIVWRNTVSIAEIEKDLTKLKESGVTHIKIFIDHYPGCEPETMFTPIIRRLETNEEFEGRKIEMQELAELQMKWDREELVRLKAKYEKGSP